MPRMDASSSRVAALGHGHQAADPEAAARLTDRERALLDFERQWWRYAGAKENALRELFDLSATRYYQVLNALIDRPEALAYDPMLVKRLRRLRAQRQRSRSARRLGLDD
jgi:hypothetical protein